MSRTWYALVLACSLGAAGYVYLYRLDAYTETELMEFAPLWVGPAAFGLAGLAGLRLGARRPLAVSLWAAFAAEVLLLVFLFALFPLL